MSTQEEASLLPTHTEDGQRTIETSQAGNKEVLHWFIVLLVFALAGSTTARVVTPLLHVLGIQGGFLAGPWSFRILYFIIMTICYPFILLFFGTIFGKREYFTMAVKRMLNHLRLGNLFNRRR